MSSPISDQKNCFSCIASCARKWGSYRICQQRDIAPSLLALVASIVILFTALHWGSTFLYVIAGVGIFGGGYFLVSAGRQAEQKPQSPPGTTLPSPSWLDTARLWWQSQIK